MLWIPPVFKRRPRLDSALHFNLDSPDAYGDCRSKVIDNGVRRRIGDRPRFEDMVRILERLRYKMLDGRVDAAKSVRIFPYRMPGVQRAQRVIPTYGNPDIVHGTAGALVQQHYQAEN